MKKISDFFSKFSKLKPSNRITTESFLNILKKNNLTLDRTDISIRNNTIYIASSPVIKSEIFTQKERIISELNAVLKDVAIKDIR